MPAPTSSSHHLFMSTKASHSFTLTPHPTLSAIQILTFTPPPVPLNTRSPTGAMLTSTFTYTSHLLPTPTTLTLTPCHNASTDASTTPQIMATFEVEERPFGCALLRTTAYLPVQVSVWVKS